MQLFLLSDVDLSPVQLMVRDPNQNLMTKMKMTILIRAKRRRESVEMQGSIENQITKSCLLKWLDCNTKEIGTNHLKDSNTSQYCFKCTSN